jgi:hypothetical protein
MISVRVIAIDQIGLGQSDKSLTQHHSNTRRSFNRHVRELLKATM